MARFYANENFPLPVVETLRQLGHDVLTTQEAGEAGKSVPDEQVLEFAAAESRVLLTLNRKHFIYLHNANPDHAGVVVCSFDPDFSGQAYRIHNATETKGRLSNELIRINRPQR